MSREQVLGIVRIFLCPVRPVMMNDFEEDSYSSTTSVIEEMIGFGADGHYLLVCVAT